MQDSLRLDTIVVVTTNKAPAGWRLHKRPLGLLIGANLAGLLYLVLLLLPASAWSCKPTIARYQVAEPYSNAPLDNKNKPKPVGQLMTPTQEGISLQVEPMTMVTGPTGKRGRRLLVINGTRSDRRFIASDYSLILASMARNRNDSWQRLEEFPWSTCGSSYHRVTLPARHFWEIPASVFVGYYPTTIRYGLAVDERTCIYSNEFAGLVNLGQFVPLGGARQGEGSGPMAPFPLDFEGTWTPDERFRAAGSPKN